MARLDQRVAVVAGATRGAGRAIAVQLGHAGATVYCTGRSVTGHTTGRPETIDETADQVTRAGGRGIAVRVDHTDPDQVNHLAQVIQQEQLGRLDILVNDIWGGDALTDWHHPFWAHDLRDGLTLLERAVTTHIITAHALVPLMVARRQGLVVEVTDGHTWAYRGSFFYDLAKVAAMRMAKTMAEELKSFGVTAIAVTPGYLRSEAVLDRFGVGEPNWRDAIAQDKFFAFSETPHYLGRAVVALATDPNVAKHAGQTLATWDLAETYGFTDLDGARPHWQRNFVAVTQQES